MCKKSCLGCKNYKHSETKVVGREFVCDGMMSVPVYKDFQAHCDEHPEYFKKWWEDNGSKTRNDEDYYEPVCYEPTEFTRQIDEMINLMNDILDKISKKDEQEKISQ